MLLKQTVLEKKSQKYQMVLLDIVSDSIRSFVEQVDSLKTDPRQHENH